LFFVPAGYSTRIFKPLPLFWGLARKACAEPAEVSAKIFKGFS
jgi:hypothetical protein